MLEAILTAMPDYYRAKIIQVECNHNLPPPLTFQDRCKRDAYGHSAAAMWDLNGCSVQAAYDVLAPHGYQLLQYDWPDAVFVHADAAAAFPCLSLDLAWTYWQGYRHAREHYMRFVRYVNHPGWTISTPAFARRAAQDPVGVLEELVLAYGASWSKRPLRIDMGVSGTGITLTIQDRSESPPWSRERGLTDLQLTWRNASCKAIHARAEVGSQALLGTQQQELQQRVVWSGAAGCNRHYKLRCRPMPYLDIRQFPPGFSEGLRLLEQVERQAPYVKRPPGHPPCEQRVNTLAPK